MQGISGNRGTRRAVDDRLISGLFMRGAAAALRSWLLTSGPSPICRWKPVSRKACPGIYIPGYPLNGKGSCSLPAYPQSDHGDRGSPKFPGGKPVTMIPCPPRRRPGHFVCGNLEVGRKDRVVFGRTGVRSFVILGAAQKMFLSEPDGGVFQVIAPSAQNRIPL